MTTKVKEYVFKLRESDNDARRAAFAKAFGETEQIKYRLEDDGTAKIGKLKIEYKVETEEIEGLECYKNYKVTTNGDIELSFETHQQRPFSKGYLGLYLIANIIKKNIERKTKSVDPEYLAKAEKEREIIRIMKREKISAIEAAKLLTN